MKMEKKDILAAARRENKNGDEMYREAQIKSGDLSAAFATIICGLFIIVESALSAGYTRTNTILWTIMMCIYGAKYLSLGIMTHRRSWLVIGIFECVVCVFGIVLYCVNLFGGGIS